MSLRVVTCKRCGHEWATAGKPKRCAKCRTPYWAKRRADEPLEAKELIQRHPKLTEEELRAVEEAAGLATEEDWKRYEEAAAARGQRLF